MESSQSFDVCMGSAVIHHVHDSEELAASPEWEVVEVLMHGMARGASAWVWWLVDEHGVHGLDVGAGEALHIVQHLKKHTHHIISKEGWGRVRAQRLD